jgi:hypothetical protein
MQYQTPRLVAFGSVARKTLIFGAASAGDVLLDKNGEIVLEDDLSIDACAERDGKCICVDNSTC